MAAILLISREPLSFFPRLASITKGWEICSDVISWFLPTAQRFVLIR